MGIVKVRWLIARKQKGHVLYYWHPPKRDRERWGLLPRALGKDVGQAVVQAAKLNAEADAVRNGAAPVSKDGTISWLIALFERDDAFRSLKPGTQRFYREYLSLIDKHMGHIPVSALRPKDLRQVYNYVKHEEGKARKAEGIVQTVRRLYSFARDIDPDTYPPNPFLRFKLKVEAQERTKWTKAQVATFIQAAIEAGRTSIALAAYLAYYTAQRESDILNLRKPEDIISPVVDFESGGVIARYGIRRAQAKRGGRVSIPIVDAWLEAQIEDRPDGLLIVSEVTQTAYTQRHFQRLVKDIRRAAGLPDALQFGALRNSRLQHMADGGATEDQLLAMSGHANRATLKHYVWPSPALALGAIRRAESGVKLKGSEGGS